MEYVSNVHTALHLVLISSFSAENEPTESDTEL